MIRAILFEDVKKYQVQLKKLLDATGKVFITASFGNAKEAVKQVKKYNPDIVLMDIEMPFVSGIEALEQIKKNKNTAETNVLLLTGVEDDDKVFHALCFGASGYVLKTDAANIEKAVEDAVAGGTYFSPSIGARIVRLFQHHVPRSQKGYVELSEQQTNVLKHMVDGLKAREIAVEMDIAFDTVRGHIKETYRKLHVNCAQAAVREAILRGIA